MTCKQICGHLGGARSADRASRIDLLAAYGTAGGAGFVILAEQGFACYGTRQVLTQ